MTTKKATTVVGNKVTNNEEAEVKKAPVLEIEEGETEETETDNEEVSLDALEDIEATILKVIIPQGADTRVTFVLDKEFTTLDFSTGEEKVTNMFGLNIYAVVNQVSPFVPEIQLADALALGECVNPQIISLAMVNAKIRVKREFHAKGEARKNSKEVYARNCITSEITSVKTNIIAVFSQMLSTIIATKSSKPKTSAIPNPFGM